MFSSSNKLSSKYHASEVEVDTSAYSTCYSLTAPHCHSQANPHLKDGACSPLRSTIPHQFPCCRFHCLSDHLYLSKKSMVTSSSPCCKGRAEMGSRKGSYIGSESARISSSQLNLRHIYLPVNSTSAPQALSLLPPLLS